MEDEASGNWQGRWKHILNFLSSTAGNSSQDILTFLREGSKILVVGAGGLGCELLKSLALSGFGHIDVIDMDTIDLSNLNRQFLFRKSDIGRPKAEAAADFINKRIPGCKVVPHYGKIQDRDACFYRQFHLVVLGLDSVLARRWMNGMLVSLLEYDCNDGSLQEQSIVPFVDGGTEGFQGNARVVVPGKSACIECSIGLYPPQVTYPLCTIAHQPRLPEHCIEYAKVLLWPQEKPFGDGVAVDGDNPVHIQWLFAAAEKRAAEYNIDGVTYRLTQGVVKHIVPAVASTNAAIAAACAGEAFKLVAGGNPMNNYMMFNDSDGVYCSTIEMERDETCPACSTQPRWVHFKRSDTLQMVIEYFCTNPSLQMKAPGITAMVESQNTTLYMPQPKLIEQSTRCNLQRSLADLCLTDGHQLVVADVTSPKCLLFNIRYDD